MMTLLVDTEMVMLSMREDLHTFATKFIDHIFVAPVGKETCRSLRLLDQHKIDDRWPKLKAARFGSITRLDIQFREKQASLTSSMRLHFHITSKQQD